MFPCESNAIHLHTNWRICSLMKGDSWSNFEHFLHKIVRLHHVTNVIEGYALSWKEIPDKILITFCTRIVILHHVTNVSLHISHLLYPSFTFWYFLKDAYYGHYGLLLQHQHRDGRLEEVVLRHLGSEDGSTVIAKNIRSYILQLLFPYDLATLFTW